jgi:hypothetical protein
MNDLLKSLSKALHPLGYHIRPRRGLNFLKIPALETPVQAENISTPRKAINALSTPPEGNLDALHIYLRTCIRPNRNANPRPLLTGADQAENALRCFNSLLHAIEFAKGPTIKLTIMDDRSEAQALARIKSLLLQTDIAAEIRTTAQTGQGASLYETFSAGPNDDALVYFVEDDYLHEQDALLCLWNFYKSMAARAGSHLVLYPQEHNALYSDHYPSYIVAGDDRHWRSVRNATHTFLTHGTVVKKFWPLFENTKYVGIKKKRKLGSENRTTNRLFDHVPGFSPLRPCAVHLQYEELLPPFFDWKRLWEKSEI